MSRSRKNIVGKELEKMLKIIVVLFLVVSVVYVAGCASKIISTENSTQGALEHVTPAVTPIPAVTPLVSPEASLAVSPTPAMNERNPDAQVVGLFIEFADGTTEPEVRSILEKYDLSANYTINYNSDIIPKRYYIIVDKEKGMAIKDELRKEENWTDPESRDLVKRNNFIITVPEQIIRDKNFLTILEKSNLQVNKSVACYICFGDGYKTGILVENAIKIKDDIEMNEKKVLTVTPETQVGDLSIEFENGTTEQEVKAILENSSMTANYTVDYDIDYIRPNHYILVDKDKIMSVRLELAEVKNWNEYEFVIKKGNYYIIEVPDEYINDENFLKILNKNNLQLKKSVWCCISFENESKNWILPTDALRIKNELEIYNKVLTVFLEYLCY